MSKPFLSWNFSFSKTCEIKPAIRYTGILGDEESLESMFPYSCSSKIRLEEKTLRKIYIA